MQRLMRARSAVRRARTAPLTSSYLCLRGFAARPVTEEHVVRAMRKDRELSESYEALDVSDSGGLEARRKRLIYRAKQRGW